MNRELDFNSEDFAGMRFVVNEEMKKVVSEMKRKALPKGSLTLKITIGMVEVPDDDGEIRQVFIFDPDIKSGIGAKYKAKCNPTGGEIIFDEDGNLAVGRQNQISMDELIEEQKEAEKKGA